MLRRDGRSLMDGTRLRDDLADLVPYDPDMRPVRVMLSANENNYGLPPAVREELARRLAQVDVNRYPDATSPRVRELLAQMWGVDPRAVVVGNGGDELIFNLALGFGGPGRALVSCPPTFSAYELYAQLTQTPVVNVARRPDFALDEPAVLEAARRPDVALVVLTSPNNPSGNLGRVEFVRELAHATEALVVVDEAYGEFCDPAASCVPLVAECPNVCVLRTLSKAYALAGARVGYLICAPQVADGLLAVRQPYSVNRLSQVAAEVVLEMRAEMRPAVEAILAERTRLVAQLRALADEVAHAHPDTPRIEVFDSEANFVLVRLPEGQGAGAGEADAAGVAGEGARAPRAGLPSADEVHERLAAASVLVRNFSHSPGLRGCLRISVGTPAESDELIARLRAILGLGHDPTAAQAGQTGQAAQAGQAGQAAQTGQADVAERQQTDRPRQAGPKDEGGE